MTTTHENQQLHLPQSPPPSPPRRRHKQKRTDTWEKLASTPLPSPSAPSTPTNEYEQSQEWTVTRIILTPLYFTSFLISLFIVNRSDRMRRTSSSSRSQSILSYFSPSAWIDPEPYQDPDNTTWGRRDSAAHAEPPSTISPSANHPASNHDPNVQQNKGRKTSSWHLRKKIRKMAKLEVSDAFEMRGRILVVMVCCLILLSAGVWVGLRWVVAWLWR